MFLGILPLYDLRLFTLSQLPSFLRKNLLMYSLKEKGHCNRHNLNIYQYVFKILGYVLYKQL